MYFILSLIDNTLMQGAILGIAAGGMLISLRVLKFPDLTVDGSFLIGASASTSMVLHGVPFPLAIILGTILGFLAGCCTGILHTMLNCSKLLAGILTTMMSYSISFRIMGSKSNLSLLNYSSIFSAFNLYDQKVSNFLSLDIIIHGISNLFFLLILLLIFTILYLLFHTEFGLIFRTVGDNEILVEDGAHNINFYKIIGLGLANSLVAFAGIITAFNQGFADINMGFGIIIVTIAALVIGEEIVSRFNSNLYMPISLTLSPIIGSFLYYFAILLILKLSIQGLIPVFQIQPTDLKMISALVLIAVIWIKKKRREEMFGFEF